LNIYGTVGRAEKRVVQSWNGRAARAAAPVGWLVSEIERGEFFLVKFLHPFCFLLEREKFLKYLRGRIRETRCLFGITFRVRQAKQSL
jgi:hypothetical protein